MVSSSGQGAQAVTLLKFLTLGDPQQNCEKFIQLFKDWCELNGWYDTMPLPPPTEKGVETQLASQRQDHSAIAAKAALRRGTEGTRDYSQTFQGIFHSE